MGIDFWWGLSYIISGSCHGGMLCILFCNGKNNHPLVLTIAPLVDNAFYGGSTNTESYAWHGKYWQTDGLMNLHLKPRSSSWAVRTLTPSSSQLPSLWRGAFLTANILKLITVLYWPVVVWINYCTTHYRRQQEMDQSHAYRIQELVPKRRFSSRGSGSFQMLKGSKVVTINK